MEHQLKRVSECFTKLKELQKLCYGCGYKIELVTADEDIERFIRRLSSGVFVDAGVYAWDAAISLVRAFSFPNHGVCRASRYVYFWPKVVMEGWRLEQL